MINNKETQAITLIALVITIVVMLILATVTINLTLGDNGIFKRAKMLKEQYQNAESQEKMDIAKTTNEIDTYVDGNRDTITVNKDDWDALVTKVNSLTPNDIDMELVITPTQLFQFDTYTIGDEVVIIVRMDASIPAGGNTKLAKLPEGFYPIYDDMLNSAYLYNSNNGPFTGLLRAKNDGYLYISNWASVGATQVQGQLRYRYK